MLDEYDVTQSWQRLFHGQKITSSTLAEAESLINQLSLESPLRLHFKNELEEIRDLHQKPR